MIRVEFENSYGKHRVIGYGADEQEANRTIMDFLSLYNYKSPYFRYWSPEKGHIVIDTGSWSEFFHFYDEDTYTAPEVNDEEK